MKTLVYITSFRDISQADIAQIEEKYLHEWRKFGQIFGIRFLAIDMGDLELHVADGSRLLHKGTNLLRADHAFMVSNLSMQPYSRAFMETLSCAIGSSPALLLNSTLKKGFGLEDNKFVSQLIVASLGIPYIPTFAVPPMPNVREAVNRIGTILGRGPYILKPTALAAGISVLKVDTEEMLMSAMDMCTATSVGYIVQPFLSDVDDLRVYILDGNIEAVQRRRPLKGNVLANQSRGASRVSDSVPHDLLASCLRICSHLSAEYLCIDWLVRGEIYMFNEWCTIMGGFSGLSAPDRDRFGRLLFRWIANRIDENSSRFRC